jgi:hypothetical protein
MNNEHVWKYLSEGAARLIGVGGGWDRGRGSGMAGSGGKVH